MRVLLAQLRGFGAPGERERAQRADDVEVVQPMGLRVRPAITSSLEAVVVETPSGERIAVVLVDKARAEGAVEAEVGETQLHGLAEQSAVIRIRASGDIELSPKSGRNVIVAGGTLKVARETDGVRIGTLTATAPPSGGPVVFTFTPMSADGTPGVPSAPGPTLALRGVISSTDCAPHFKG
jgi:hypothetical protein